MPPAWPKEVREAAWTLRCEGLMAAAITREINAGAQILGGVPYDVKRATVTAWLEKFYEQRGKPENTVRQGEELDVANAELRRILSWAKEKRREIMARDSGADKDLTSMTKVTALIAQAEKALRESQLRKDPERVDAGSQPKRPPKGILDQIARDEEARNAGPDDAAPSPPDAIPEPQPPSIPAPASTGQPDQESDPFGTSGVPWPD